MVYFHDMEGTGKFWKNDGKNLITIQSIEGAHYVLSERMNLNELDSSQNLLTEYMLKQLLLRGSSGTVCLYVKVLQEQELKKEIT